MDTIECIMTRKSARKFLPTPVPRDLLAEVLEAARYAPSYRNSQPWEVTVVSGAKKVELSNLLVELIDRGTPNRPDIPAPTTWPPAIDARMKETMLKRAAALGQDLKDPELPKRAKTANMRFYGAPHGLFFHQDASLSAWSIFDAGGFAQTVMLAAHAKGLATVPQGYLTDYAPEIKNFLGISEGNRLLLGMSIGYSDPTDPAATFRSGRMALRDFVTWRE